MTVSSALVSQQETPIPPRFRHPGPLSYLLPFFPLIQNESLIDLQRNKGGLIVARFITQHSLPGLRLAANVSDRSGVQQDVTGVIGAAHAGWKGALGGIVEAAVDAMTGLGAKKDQIQAAIGPCIQQASYEVGAEFRVRFMNDDPTNREFFIASSRDGHFMFDLPAFLGRQFDTLGVAYETLGLDTCADEVRFFSYRRATQRREIDYGRGLASILLREG